LFKASLKSYSSIFLWFLHDSVWQNKLLTLIILSTGFMGVMFQVQVFGMIIYYTKHFSSGEVISLGPYLFDPRSSIPLLVGGSLSVAVLLSVAAFCLYFSRKKIITMSRQYEKAIVKRIFQLLGMHIDIFSSVTAEQSGNDAYLFRLAKSDSRVASRSLRKLLSLIIPVITLCVCVSVLFYLEIGFSLIIIFLGVIFLFYQYRVSKTALRHAIRFERLAPMAAKEYRSIIQHCKFQSHVNENFALIEKIFTRGPVKQQMDAYEGRLQAMENSRFVSNVFMAAITSLIILVMGGAIIIDGTGWGRLLMYVVALRFAMTNLQATFTTLTAINRFYPQLRRNYYFVQSFVQKGQNQYVPLDKYELHLPKETGIGKLENTSDRVILEPGRALALITSLDVNRYSLAEIIRGLLGDNEKAVQGALSSMRFATSGPSCPGCSLRQLLHLPGSAGWKDIRLPRNSLSRLQQVLPNNLDKPVNQNVWEKIDPDLKFFLSLSSALLCDCQWIILEEEGMALMDQKSFSFFRPHLREKICVIVFNSNLSHVGKYAEDVVAVMEEASLIGLGTIDWFAGVQSEVQDRLRITGRKKGASLNELEDEDELDEF
jgi:ABC-type multidrug transport system fused ATPase/permease subunit